MRPEKKVSFTPLPPPRGLCAGSGGRTRPESWQDPLAGGQEGSGCDHQLPPLDKSPCSLPAPLPQKHWWTPEEDEKLQQLVQEFGARNWKKIASFLADRTDVQCLHRWQKVLNPSLVKGPWTQEEDELVLRLVNQNGPRNWSFIAKQLPGRIGKQCRERWHNHLNPEISKDRWTEEEDRLIVQAHREYGNKWALIAKLLPGRTDNSIKNHWNSTIKRRLRLAHDQPQQGVARQLCFATPTKEAAQEHLLDSACKAGPLATELVLVMPLLRDQMQVSAVDLLRDIHQALGSQDFNNQC